MAFSFLLLLLFLLAAADERPVADLVLQPGVPVVAEGGEVVDPGRGRLGAGLPVTGAGLRVAVPADRERDGGPGRLPAGPDLGMAQVERVLWRSGHYRDPVPVRPAEAATISANSRDNPWHLTLSSDLMTLSRSTGWGR
jgi:hypothetical protein